jgi:hypothetical protein
LHKADRRNFGKDIQMTPPLDLPTLIAHVRLSLQGTAKNAVQRLWGPEGPPWGTAFDNLEELAVQIGQIVAHEVLQQSLAAQAQAPLPPQAHVCPSCGRAPTAQPAEPHVVRSRAGEVTWAEPTATCGHCRKAFFPSRQGVGH